MGPIQTATLPVRAQIKIIQTRAVMLKTSSMLPATTMVGMADKTPAMNRATITAARDGTEATMAEKAQ